MAAVVASWIAIAFVRRATRPSYQSRPRCCGQPKRAGVIRIKVGPAGNV